MLSEHEKALKAVEKSKAARARAFVSRPIRHPTFKNVNALKATELLKDADVGACLLRPSSRGFTSIILTIKVDTPAFLHFFADHANDSRLLPVHDRKRARSATFLLIERLQTTWGVVP